MSPDHTMTWVIVAAGVLVAHVGLLLILGALFGDRARGLRRCPKCWYDLSGTPGTLKCSECGHEAKKEKRLLRTRRRWGWVAIGLAVLGAGAGAIVGATMTFDEIVGAVPMGVWSRVLPLFPKASADAYQKMVSQLPAMTPSLPSRFIATPPSGSLPTLQRLLAAQYMAGMFRRNEADPTLYLFVGGNELGTALPLLERAVREQLSSPDPRRRRQCAEALSWFPAVSERTFAELDRRLGVEEDSEVVDPILSNFEHRSRAPSRKSLVHAGGFAGHKGVRSVCNLLRLFRDEQPHLLCELCNSGNGEMLAAAAERIPEFGPRCVGATPGLARQLTDDTYLFYRSWLCQALEEIGPGARDSLPALEHVLKTDANSPARMYACRAMASIGRDDPQSIAGTLGEALADEERLVRIEAAKGLSMLGAGALPARNKLRAAAKDPDREFRQWVAKSLEAIEPKQP